MREILRAYYELLTNNIRNLTLDEALFAGGGYRSVLGLLKHIGGWTHVYRSYAFDAAPRHWEQTSWPRGLREEIEPAQAYLDEVIAWIDASMAAWDADLDGAAADELRPVHWGGTAMLSDIVMMMCQHFAYHAGEINMLLSMARDEAWEIGEEVEENHIDTFGHGVRAGWMSDDVAAATEARLRAAHDRRRRASSP